ncbi:hypothetical protein PAMA_007785 [Pampus argenteus]
MFEQRQKGKTLENGCHDRRLGLCAVYLSLFLTAMFLSVLTPCQPHLARALWVAGRRQRWRSSQSIHQCPERLDAYFKEKRREEKRREEKRREEKRREEKRREEKRREEKRREEKRREEKRREEKRREEKRREEKRREEKRREEKRREEKRREEKRREEKRRE